MHDDGSKSWTLPLSKLATAQNTIGHHSNPDTTQLKPRTCLQSVNIKKVNREVDPLDPLQVLEYHVLFFSGIYLFVVIIAFMYQGQILSNIDSVGKMADSTASGPLWQQRPLPAPGQVLRNKNMASGGKQIGPSL